MNCHGEFINIGFDFREYKKNEAGEFLTKNSNFLPCNKSDRFWSIDRQIWPSLVHDGVNNYGLGGDWDYGLNVNVLGNRISLAELIVEIGNKKICSGVIFSASVLVIPSENIGQNIRLAIEEGSTINSINFKSNLLGFDVACEELYSSLANCGINLEEKTKSKISWNDNLNQYGLFKSIDAAIEFSQFSNCRIQEHGQFYVFKLEECTLI